MCMIGRRTYPFDRAQVVERLASWKWVRPVPRLGPLVFVDRDGLFDGASMVTTSELVDNVLAASSSSRE